VEDPCVLSGKKGEYTYNNPLLPTSHPTKCSSYPPFPFFFFFHNILSLCFYKKSTQEISMQGKSTKIMYLSLSEFPCHLSLPLTHLFSAPAPVHVRACARARTHTYTHTHTHAHTHTHTHIYTYTRARAHAHTHIHTHAHTHIHTHAHTHTHTHTQPRSTTDTMAFCLHYEL